MQRPEALPRALVSPEFWLLGATAAAGSFGVAWWVAVPLCVAGLSISSLPKYVRLWPKAFDLGAEVVLWRTVGLSALGTVAASGAAFGLGVVLRVLFAG